ncbi:retrovirus-related pol polyprotein from transposon TNT 1-94 [Tanacetum coccineum]
MVVDLRYFNSLENEVDSLKSQLETQKTQFLNEIDRISKEYYYADHMNAILCVYTTLDEFTDLQCDYVDQEVFILVLAEPQLKSNRSRKIKSLHKIVKTKMPMVVPISTREPKRTVNQSVATPLKRTVASESTNQKPRSKIRKQYEQISKTCRWWYSKITPPGYKWKPKTSTVNVKPNLVEIILFIVDSGCSKLMTGNLKLLSNFVDKFLGTVKFRNDQIAPILGYGDLVQGNVPIKGGNDLLTGSRGTDLYSITLQDTSTPNLIFLMAKASTSQAWLWHRRLSHLNFDTINLLSKYDIVTGLPKLKFVKIIFVLLVSWEKKNVITEFLNKTLHAYFAQEGIEHQTSIARTPEQNGVVERRNRTLVEAARTMLSAAKVPFFFWAEAITTTCFTQNRSLIIRRHKKTPYHIINGHKPSVKFFYIFGSLCYIVRDGENLEKMKEKADACIFVGYSTQSRAYKCSLRNFETLPVLSCPQSQENVLHLVETVTTSNELDLLFSLMFDELLNGTTQVVSKSSTITTANAPNQCQQQHTTPSTSTTVAADTPPLNIQTTPATTSQAPTQAPIITATENTNQAET